MYTLYGPPAALYEYLIKVVITPHVTTAAKNCCINPCKMSRDKHISKWVDRENRTYVRLNQKNLNQKLCIKMNKIIDRGKRSKPVENVNQNLQVTFFLKKIKTPEDIITLHLCTKTLDEIFFYKKIILRYSVKD